MSRRWIGVLLVVVLMAGTARGTLARTCQLEEFTDQAKTDGWMAQELTYDERVNFLNHLNNDDGVRSNFYPPHLWETVRKGRDDLVHIRVVFLDDGNCVLGNSGEIGFNEISYLLAPDLGY